MNENDAMYLSEFNVLEQSNGMLNSDSNSLLTRHILVTYSLTEPPNKYFSTTFHSNALLQHYSFAQAWQTKHHRWIAATGLFKIFTAWFIYSTFSSFILFLYDKVLEKLTLLIFNLYSIIIMFFQTWIYRHHKVTLPM